MQDTKIYTRTLRKRGRPIISKHRTSLGFDIKEEIQEKRRILTGKASKAHLNATFFGILHTRRFLNKEEYNTCVDFLKLTWAVNRIMESPTLSKVHFKDVSSRIQRVPLTEKEKEAFDRKKLKCHFDIFKELQKLGPHTRSLAMAVIQSDQRPSTLLRLLTDKTSPRGLQDLKKLKIAIKVIKNGMKLEGRASLRAAIYSSGGFFSPQEFL